MLKGTKHTEETKRKLSEINKGKKLSKETKRKLSIIHKGRIPWNKDKKMSEEFKNKMSEIRKGYKHTKKTKRKMSIAHKGKKKTEETKRKLSIAHKGNQYALGYKHTEEAKKRMSKRIKQLFSIKENHPMYGTHRSEKVKQKISISKKGIPNLLLKQLWQNSEYRKKTVKAVLKASHIKPNKPELQLQGILNELYPKDWQYVGDGKVILNGFCPDFININGKKQIIEMNGNYWHNRKGVGEKDQRKIETYKQLGYNTLIIWEGELKNINNVKNKIQEFCV